MIKYNTMAPYFLQIQLYENPNSTFEFLEKGMSSDKASTARGPRRLLEATWTWTPLPPGPVSNVAPPDCCSSHSGPGTATDDRDIVLLIFALLLTIALNTSLAVREKCQLCAKFRALPERWPSSDCWVCAADKSPRVHPLCPPNRPQLLHLLTTSPSWHHITCPLHIPTNLRTFTLRLPLLVLSNLSPYLPSSSFCKKPNIYLLTAHSTYAALRFLLFFFPFSIQISMHLLNV